eukprot:5520337-Pyramimonas_sp.AAC.1
MPRAVVRDPFVVNAAEVAKAWPIGVRGGLLQQEILRVVRADAAQLLDVDRPWNRRTDPGQAAVLRFARTGCQLVRRNLLLDHRQREID